MGCGMMDFSLVKSATRTSATALATVSMELPACAASCISNTSSVSTSRSGRIDRLKHMMELPGGKVILDTDVVKSSPFIAGGRD